MLLNALPLEGPVFGEGYTFTGARVTTPACADAIDAAIARDDTGLPNR